MCVRRKGLQKEIPGGSRKEMKTEENLDQIGSKSLPDALIRKLKRRRMVSPLALGRGKDNSSTAELDGSSSLITHQKVLVRAAIHV